MGWDDLSTIDGEVREYTKSKRSAQSSPKQRKPRKVEPKLSEFGAAVKVISVYGFGAKGSMVVNHMAKEENPDSSRALGNVSEKVGLEIENVSDALTLNIPVRSWSKDVKGVYRPKDATLTVAPGKTGVIEEKDFILWALKTHNTQGSVRFTNWIVKRSSLGSTWRKSSGHGKPKECPDFTNPESYTHDHAEWYTTCPTMASGIRVHDSEFKKPCARLVNGSWIVKDEFKSIFGFLETPAPESTPAVRKVRTVQSRVSDSIRNEFLSEMNSD